MQVTIYHNPRCSKSRQALAMIEEKGIEPQVIEYLKSPPGAAELKRVLRLLGMKPRDLMRKQEEPYKKNKLDDPSLDDDALIAAMVTDPILIERPVVVVDGKLARLGRPPEQVLEIL